MLSRTTHTPLLYVVLLNPPLLSFSWRGWDPVSLSSQLTLHRLWPQTLLLLWLKTHRCNTGVIIWLLFRLFRLEGLEARSMVPLTSNKLPLGSFPSFLIFRGFSRTLYAFSFFLFFPSYLFSTTHWFIVPQKCEERLLFACELVQVNRWMYWFWLLLVGWS